MPKEENNKEETFVSREELSQILNWINNLVQDWKANSAKEREEIRAWFRRSTEMLQMQHDRATALLINQTEQRKDSDQTHLRSLQRTNDALLSLIEREITMREQRQQWEEQTVIPALIHYLKEESRARDREQTKRHRIIQNPPSSYVTNPPSPTPPPLWRKEAPPTSPSTKEKEKLQRELERLIKKEMQKQHAPPQQPPSTSPFYGATSLEYGLASLEEERTQLLQMIAEMDKTGEVVSKVANLPLDSLEESVRFGNSPSDFLKENKPFQEMFQAFIQQVAQKKPLENSFLGNQAMSLVIEDFTMIQPIMEYLSTAVQHLPAGQNWITQLLDTVLFKADTGEFFVTLEYTKENKTSSPHKGDDIPPPIPIHKETSTSPPADDEEETLDK